MSDYQQEAVRMTITSVIDRKSNDRELERWLIECVRDVYQTSPKQHTKFLLYMRNMGRLHALYAECYYNAKDANILTSTKAFCIIDKVCHLIAKKRKRIILKGGLELIQAHPTLTRSSYCGTDAFVSMSVVRSVEDGDLMRKWMELDELIMSLTFRLKALKMTLQCMQNIVLFASDCESESEMMNTLERGSHRVIKAVREVSDSH